MARKKSSADVYKKLLDRVESLDLGRGGFWRPSEGRSTIRILPPVGTMDFFFKEVGVHRLGNQRFYCPAICTDGEDPCPICEVNEELWQSGEKETASRFRVQRRFWMNVVVRGKEPLGPQMYTPGITVFGSVVSLIKDPDYGDVTDEEDGFDIKIDRTGTDITTTYQTRAARNPSPLSDDEDEMEEWLTGATDIEEFVSNKLLDYDDLAEKAGVDVFLDGGELDLDDEPEEPEEESASSAIERRLKRRTRSRRKR